MAEGSYKAEREAKNGAGSDTMSSPGLVFALLKKGYLSLYIYEHFDGLYVVDMVVLS